MRTLAGILLLTLLTACQPPKRPADPLAALELAEVGQPKTSPLGVTEVTVEVKNTGKDRFQLVQVECVTRPTDGGLRETIQAALSDVGPGATASTPMGVSGPVLPPHTCIIARAVRGS